MTLPLLISQTPHSIWTYCLYLPIPNSNRKPWLKGKCENVLQFDLLHYFYLGAHSFFSIKEFPQYIKSDILLTQSFQDTSVIFPALKNGNIIKYLHLLCCFVEPPAKNVSNANATTSCIQNTEHIAPTNAFLEKRLAKE